MEKTKKRITFEISAELDKRIKDIAKSRGTSFKCITVFAIREFLKEERGWRK